LPSSALSFRIAVLVSGSGTNLQAIIDKVHDRDGVEVVAVASSKPGVKALERAESAGVESAVFDRSDYDSRADRDRAMAAWLKEREVELVVLAGFMELLDAAFLGEFPGRVINVHPALLRVHQRDAVRQPARVQGLDLVLHERHERRDDDRQVVAQQRRQLVAERLARAGGHDDEHVASGQSGLAGLTLAGPEGGETEVLPQCCGEIRYASHPNDGFGQRRREIPLCDEEFASSFQARGRTGS